MIFISYFTLFLIQIERLHMKIGTSIFINWGFVEDLGKKLYGTYLFTGIWFPVGDQYFIQFDKKDKTLTAPLNVEDLTGKCTLLGKIEKTNLPKKFAALLK